MMSTTLYITDLDGTLLNDSSEVSADTAAMLCELSEQGAMVTAATARTPATVQPLLGDCRLNVPAVVMTGAAMWDFATRSYIHPVFMADSLYRKVMDVFHVHGYSPFVYEMPRHDILNVFHIPGLNEAETRFYEPRKALELKRFNLTGVPREADRALLVFGTGPKQMITDIARDLGRQVECSVSCYPDIFDPATALIEVFAPGVDKASAILRLKKHVKADRVVVFGDNLNDLPMMNCADLSAAVANGLPEVREKADIVIGRNVDNAVARFIKYDFQKT